MAIDILIVAESSTLRFLIKRSFQSTIFNLIEANTLADGIKLLDEEPSIEGIVSNWHAYQTDEFKHFLEMVNSKPFNILPLIVITAQFNEDAVNWLKDRERGALTLLAQFEEIPVIMEDLMEEDSEVTAIMSEVPLNEEAIRILLVDDSKSSRAYYTRILERHNYIVEPAESVQHGWSILTSRDPDYFDLVITDYFMPNENGHALCRRIRKNPAMHNLLSSVMTGTYFDDVIDISLRSGAIECMFKEESDQLFIARVTSMARMARNQRSIQLERQRLSDILSSLGEGVYGVGVNGYINFVNPAALKILHYSKDSDLTGFDAHEKLHYLDKLDNRIKREDSKLLKVYHEAGVLRDWRTFFVDSKGKKIPVSCTVVPLMVSGTHAGSVVAFRDISRQQSMERQLRWQATHDPLTNLFNRRYFEEQLEIERHRLERNRDSFSALLFLDLDRFKYINDTAGHDAGDKILMMVSKSLSQRVRTADTLARLGGDEFAVILRDIEKATLHKTADKFREVLSTLHYSSGDHEFKVHGSIGVAEIDPFISANDIMANADIACHQAKAEGRDQTHIYDPNSDVRFTMTSELGWANKLQLALEHDQFELYFQPILAMEDIDFDNLPDPSEDLWSTHHRYRNAPPAYIETLIRMRDEKGNLVPPNLFLSSAERFGLMTKIDLWVIEKALDALQQAHDIGLYFTLGVNISAMTLEDPVAIRQIMKLIANMPVPSRHLAIEITERSAITNMVGVKSFIDEINGLGCQFALDDFGAGFSSFAQLRHLPVKYVKIDGEYVNSMDEDDTDKTIVTAINDIAHSLGRDTIAEYVTSPGILMSLKECGVDYVQGFYVAEPMSRDDLFVIYEDEPTVVSVPYEVEMR